MVNEFLKCKANMPTQTKIQQFLKKRFFAHPFSIVPPPASGDGEPAIDHELWAGAVVL